MTINDVIRNAKKIQSDIEVFKEQLSQLATPTLVDTKNIPQIYRSILKEPNIERREAKHYFVFIVIYLYSPISLLGRFPIKAGLRKEISKTIGRCQQEVSEIFSQAKFRYENVPSFHEQVETLFTKILK